jgi:hypothetical protein
LRSTAYSGGRSASRFAWRIIRMSCARSSSASPRGSECRPVAVRDGRPRLPHRVALLAVLQPHGLWVAGLVCHCAHRFLLGWEAPRDLL